MVSGWQNWGFIWLRRRKSSNFTGYCVVFDSRLSSKDVRLVKWIYPHVDISNTRTLDTYSYSGSVVGQNQIDIARNASGLIQVFLNKELILEKTDTTHIASEYFLWASFIGNSSIDNLVVTDQLDMYEAPDPTDTDTDEDDGALQFWLVPAGILLMVIYRRKKK